MPLRKLTTTDAFVVTDLADAPAAGIVRSAPKILQGGAKDLARSLTYSFATFEMKRSGASAGINAAPDARSEAVDAFVAELADDAASGGLCLDAGKGVDADALRTLTEADGRHAVRLADHAGDPLHVHLAGLGPAVAADAAVGLDGKTVAIEGLGAHGPALAEAIEARGGRVVAVSTTSGSLADTEGLSAAMLRERWSTAGDSLVSTDGEAEPAWKVFQAGADIIMAGSKMGAVNHTTAERLEVAALVAHQPIPYTARALAMLQRSGATVIADFVSVAAPLFAFWPAGDPTPDAVVTAASSAIADAVRDSLGHDDGPFLAACHRAESFLSTWQDELPFGRPLAS